MPLWGHGGVFLSLDVPYLPRALRDASRRAHVDAARGLRVRGDEGCVQPAPEA